MGSAMMAIGIVLVAVCYCGWSVFKKAAGKNSGCDCSSNCSSSCNPLEEAEKQNENRYIIS